MFVLPCVALIATDFGLINAFAKLTICGRVVFESRLTENKIVKERPVNTRSKTKNLATQTCFKNLRFIFENRTSFLFSFLGISILGFPSFHDDRKGSVRGKNTIYVFEIDGLRLAHLGDLGHALSEELVEDLGDIDILMVPVGGEYTIGPDEAANVVSAIEPTIVIPMHFQMPGLKPETFSKLTPVDSFLKEVGLTNVNLPKLILKKEELGEDKKVVVLEKK